MKKIQKIKELCEKLFEGKDTVRIRGNEIDKQELIDFVATKYRPRTITLRDALKAVSDMDLFSEVERILVNKDNSFNY